MIIKKQAMGDYQTNCYIVNIDNKDFIIDPGINALPWIKKNVNNPVAILNTHGHFDHVWSNSEVQALYDIPIYCPKEDVFYLENDPFSQGTPPSKASVLVENDEVLNITNIEIKFRHFPGHTPGCSTIEIKNAMFSGDFIFQNSIGRWDFPYSSQKDMLKSLIKFTKIDYDATIYPGHGADTSIFYEQNNTPYWIKQLA